MKQVWYCEKRGREASCTLPIHADVWLGVNKISDSHRKKSSDCHKDYGIGFVRIRAPQCSNAEWKKVREDARAKRLAELKDKFIIEAAPPAKPQPKE